MCIRDSGGEDGGAGIDCSLGSVEISGGTVTATGGDPLLKQRIR
mgnify:CR=1 FL=1